MQLPQKPVVQQER